MTEDRQKIFLIENVIKYMKNSGPNRIRSEKANGSGSGLEKFMDPDLIFPEGLDPEPVNIRPDPKP